MTEVVAFSDKDVRLLEQIRAQPICLNWHWSLQGGATLKIEIVGRWDKSDADKVRQLMGKISEIIDELSDDPPSAKPTEQAGV